MANDIKWIALKGMTWTGIDQCCGTTLRFVIGIVLARLLSPSDYGIVGMTAIFFALSQVFIDSGFANALIQKKNKTQDDYSTVFWFNVGVAFVIFSLFFLFSPQIADFYDTPILKNVARVSALGMLISAFSSIQTTRLKIELRFKELAIISLMSCVVTGLIGIGLAIYGFGVWALVLSGVAGTVLRTIALWLVNRWHPNMIFSLSSFRALFSFGSKLFGAGIINAIYQNLYSLVIGKFFTSGELGQFNRANGYAILPSSIITNSVTSVNFPILARYQDDNGRLLQMYKQIIQLPVLVLFPVTIGMATVAKPLIAVMIGEKWLPCVPLLQILSIGYLLAPLSDFNLTLLNVKGRSDLVLRLEVMKKSIGFILLFASIPLGIFGMCLARSAYIFVSCSFNCYYTKKILNYGLWEQLRDISPVIVNCLVMSGCVCVFLRFCPMAPWIALPLSVMIGFASFVLFAVVTRDKLFYSLLNLIPFCRRK